ncbi:MAG: hypothetical protein RIK87_04610 [Fuerstiella sp.]
MKYSSRSKSRARRHSSVSSPAEIDTLEARLLLATTPNILTPTGTVTTATPEFTWDAVDDADSYDLWITSLETYETVLVERGIVGTTFTPTEGQLSQGRIRIWARANLSGGGTSDWSPASEATIKAPPTLTGPTGQGTRNLTASNTPEITWTSSTAASRFQIWVTDLTAKAAAEAEANGEPVAVSVHSTVYNIPNLTPTLDENEEPILDADGNTIPEEVRSFIIRKDATKTVGEPRELPTGRYRVWIRTIDMSGQISAWSAARTFDVGPSPQNLAPAAPTFQQSPTLTWDTVDRATHYEVYVAQTGGTTPYFRYTVDAVDGTTQSTQILQSVSGPPIVDNGNGVVEPHETPRLDADGNPVPFLIPAGSYRFWVRAINMGTDLPTVVGVWSSAASFSTITGPTITAPVPDQGVVTSAQPTIEWTPIHGAARYEILVYKFNSRPPLLEATSTSTSYTFTETLPAGDYTIWVRAVDTRGNFSPWSDTYAITTTGGRPVVTSPAADELVDFPTFTWIGVAGAESYEVWVAHMGVDFTFINVDGITGTSYVPNDPADPGSVPFSDGDYRIWVRAIFADGTTGPWSTPVDFRGGVVSLEAERTDTETLLTTVEIDLQERETPPLKPVVAETPPPDDTVSTRWTGKADETGPAMPPEPAANNDVRPAVDLIPADVLTEIAGQCIDTVWWENAEKSA